MFKLTLRHQCVMITYTCISVLSRENLSAFCNSGWKKRIENGFSACHIWTELLHSYGEEK